MLPLLLSSAFTLNALQFTLWAVTRIAIIGGGIGGLSAALALRQFGFEPQVFEQAPKLLEVGGAIAVWPNAMRILQALGIGDKVLSRAGLVKEVRWLDWKGRCLNHVRLSGSAWHSNTPALALHRAVVTMPTLCVFRLL